MAQNESDQPIVYATMRVDSTGVLDVDGVTHEVTGTDDADGLARRAVTIPYGDALHGGKIRYDALAPATAAAVAEGL